MPRGKNSLLGIYDNHVSHINIGVPLFYFNSSILLNAIALSGGFFLTTAKEEKFIHTLNLRANYHKIFRGSYGERFFFAFLCM